MTTRGCSDLANPYQKRYASDMTTPMYIRRTYEPLKFLGRLFWVPMQVQPKTRHVSYAPTWEADGSRWGPTLVVRIPFTRIAVGLGVWLDANANPVAVQEEDAEYDTYCAVNGDVDRSKWAEARKVVAQKVAEMDLPPEDAIDAEMHFMQQLGCFE